MLVQKKEVGAIYECLYKSSNILRSVYDKSKKNLTITFNYGGVYEYLDVGYKDYVRFENDESQGKVFSKYIKNHETNKKNKVDVTEYLEIVKSLIKS